MVKKRKKRDVYEDPKDPDFPKQWYLVCGCLLSLYVSFDIMTDVLKTSICALFL